MLENHRYISLRTFRRSGSTVDTPVWCAPVGNNLVVFSAGRAGKVKRLRNSSQAQIAPCNARGKLLGDWTDARAELFTESTGVAAALTALRDSSSAAGVSVTMSFAVSLGTLTSDVATFVSLSVVSGVCVFSSSAR